MTAHFLYQENFPVLSFWQILVSFRTRFHCQLFCPHSLACFPFSSASRSTEEAAGQLRKGPWIVCVILTLIPSSRCDTQYVKQKLSPAKSAEARAGLLLPFSRRGLESEVTPLRSLSQQAMDMGP